MKIEAKSITTPRIGLTLPKAMFKALMQPSVRFGEIRRGRSGVSAKDLTLEQTYAMRL